MEKLKEIFFEVLAWAKLVLDVLTHLKLMEAVLCQFKYDFGYSMISRRFWEIHKMAKKNEKIDRYMCRYFEGIGMQLAPAWIEYLGG